MKLWKQFSIQKQDTIDYFNTRKDFRPDVFAARLNQLILEELDAKEKVGVMFLCIGTDRSTGDSLGPLVGHKLRARKLRRAAVIGTLDRPVHAMNLDLYSRYIRLNYPDYVVVAIDAKRRPDGSGWNIYKNGGRVDMGIDALEWARTVDRLGAGEILLTSMDCDGTKAGYDNELTAAVADAVSVPVIAAGPGPRRIFTMP